MDKKNKTTACSFCGKSREEAGTLLSGPCGYLCDDCIKLCYKIISANQKPEKDMNASSANAKSHKLPLPEEIKLFIDSFVIGQEEAKKILSVAVYNHYLRLNHQNNNRSNVELSKSNILLIGPTGCGKTFLAETLARTLNVPFAIADATTLTETGYVGNDVEAILQRLLRNCDFNIKKAETGIVYIDEIDKIAGKSDRGSVNRDVSGQGVQDDLLKMIEGTVATVPLRGPYKHEKFEHCYINTKNILFICGGSFAGLDSIIRDRTEKHGIGFSAEIYGEKDKKTLGELLRQTEPEDLIKYGMVPELVGRLPIIAVLDEIEEVDLVRILKEPNNALTKQYKELFSMNNIELEFQDEVLKSIAQKALAKKTGARGLRSILEHLLLDYMYKPISQIGQNKLIVDQKFYELHSR